MPGVYGGVNVEQPENIMGPQYSPAFNDFVIRNQEIRSRPNFIPAFIVAPDAVNRILAVVPAFGPNANAPAGYTVKLVAISAAGLWRYDGTNWHSVTMGGSTLAVAQALNPLTPVSWRIFQNVLYFSNGAPYLISWDGVSDSSATVNVAGTSVLGPFTLSAVDNAGNYTGTITGGAANAYAGKQFSILGFSNAGNNLVAATCTASTATTLSFGGVTITESLGIHNAWAFGGVTIGALFLDELDNHLILANTNESGTLIPYRVRWSANGLPKVWDPTVNVNAGLADFLEVTDAISGTIMLGRVGYIVRTNGITEIAPTGNGIAPFDFNHLWASQVGIGNILPYSIGVYGPIGTLVAEDNVYQLQASGFNPIGGLARDAVFASLGVQAATDVVNGPAIIGFITPFLFGPNAASVQSGSGFPAYPFLAYMLFMRTQPDPNTKVWYYHLEDKNWTQWNLPGVLITGRPCVSLPGSVTGAAAFLLPVYTVAGGMPSIGLFDVNNFNDGVQARSYSYRVEDIAIDRVPTVRRVVLTYRDLGVATVTTTITGTNDNGAVVTATKVVTIGNASPTGKLLTRLIDIELTAFRPQLTFSQAANGGPFCITRATILGEVEEVTL